MPVRSGRLARLARLGGMAAGLAGDAAAAVGDRVRQRARDGLRGGEVDPATARFHRKSAERMLEVLGDMKGLPQKVGQIVSIFDEALPTEHRDIYRDVLGRLQEHARPLPWEEVRPVVQQELGQPLDTVFASVDEAAVAAASIGQVHRARLVDGRQVALKVQYPGMDAALASDLDNVGALVAAMSAALPRTDVDHLVRDIARRFTDELDYQQEARAQQAAAARWAGDPDVVIPAVIPQHSSRRLLVTEWLDGHDQVAAASGPTAVRSRQAATLWGFTWKSVLQHHWLHGDPHPGNFRFLPDGRVGVLDFGCTADLPPTLVEGLDALARGVVEGAGDAELWAALQQAMGLPEQVDPDVAALWVSFSRVLMLPISAPQPFHVDAAYTRRLVSEITEAKLAMARRALWQGVPTPTTSGAMLVTRTALGQAAVLARLDVPADFRAATGL